MLVWFVFLLGHGPIPGQDYHARQACERARSGYYQATICQRVAKV
jgi:hypothetical protein